MSNEKRSYQLKARADRLHETRERIVEATLELHGELGPARTTIAEIARRAGVERLTVYNHFPEEAELFAACQTLFVSRHPFPDLGPALSLADPKARTRAVLGALYASYREREPVTTKILRDRSVLPALNGLLEKTLDANLSALASQLASGFRTRGNRSVQVRALLALALDFWTWHLLKAQGVNDDSAATLMAGVISRQATP